MTENEFMREMIKAAGGDPDKLPDRLKSTYYQCLIDCMNKGGGSNSEYKQPEWGYKEDYILPETEVTLAANEDLGMTVGLISPTTPFIAGQTYTVNYNGINYDTFMNGVFLGNGVLFGVEDTGEPFAIVVEEGQCMLIPIDQQPGTVQMSIIGKVIKPIENVYAPGVPVFDLKEFGMPEIKNDEVAEVQWNPIIFDSQIAPLLQKGIVKIRIDLLIDWKNQFAGNEHTLKIEDYCICTHVAFVPHGVYQYYFAYAFIHDAVIEFEISYEGARATIKRLSFITA